jgi:thiamine biosynthesis lipoprotein
MRRLVPAVLLAGCVLCGCRPAEPPQTNSRTIVALGTLVTVEIDGVEDALAVPALDRVEVYFHTIHREWYAFGNGELGRVNRALANNGPAIMSVRLAKLTRRSLVLRELSEGLFDPTIGMLVELWGFAGTNDEPGPPPNEAAIRDWLASRASHPGINLSARTIRADGPVKLTFGAMAKGTALNEAIDLLRESGVENAIVEAGGDLKVLGRRGDRPWRIGVRDPHSTGMLGTIDLKSGEAIVTSGNYERFFEHQGQRYHHLLDPRTGRPVTHTAGATVVHKDAELADAAATALMVAGAESFRRIADRMGIGAALLVTADGDIIMTPALADRIREPAPSRGTEPRIM